MKNWFLFILVFTLFSTNAQNYRDSVMLLSGTTFRGKIVDYSNDYLTIQTNFKIDTSKNKEYSKDSINNPQFNVDTSFSQISLEKYRLFSYVQDDKEHIIYEYDSLSENFLTVNQSKSYALGSYDARNFYKTTAVFASSAAFTFGVCLFDSYLTKTESLKVENVGMKAGFFGRSPSLLPILNVLVLPIAFGIPSTKVRPKNLVNGIRGDNYYYSGFNSTAKQRRALTALKGVGTGLALGYASYFIFHPNPF